MPTSLTNPVFAQMNTPATNDMSADGFTWPATRPVMVDKFGKILMWGQRSGGGSIRSVVLVSNTQGASWSEPTRTGMFDAAGEGFVVRCAAAYDSVNDLMHCLWQGADPSDGIIYRRYSFTRDGSNNITAVNRIAGVNLQIDFQSTGTMNYQHPSIVWIPEGTGHGSVLCVWGARNSAAATIKTEIRATMRALSNTTADNTPANWAAPVTDDATTIGNDVITPYSIVDSANVVEVMYPTIMRKVAGATAGDVCVGYHDGNNQVAGGSWKYRRLRWNAGAKNWSTGLSAIVTLSPMVIAGTDTGYSLKNQCSSQLTEDTVNDRVYFGFPVWVSNTLGDTQSFKYVDSADVASARVDIVSASAVHAYAPVLDIHFDDPNRRLMVIYQKSSTRFFYTKTYNGVTPDQPELAVYTGSITDMPLIYPGRYTVGTQDKLLVAFRDAVNTPTPPYHGYFGTLDVATLVFANGTYPARVVADGASNYWRLGEGSGTIAVDVIGGADGTISGGVTLAQPGVTVDGNKAMTFNGTTGKVVTTQPATFAATFTVEAWIRTSTPAGQLPVLSTPLYGGGHDLYACYLSNGGRIGVYRVDRNVTTSSVSGVRSVSDGQWHHAAWVFPGGTAVELYVDGVLDKTGALTGAPVAVDTQIVELGYYSNAPLFWPGGLDEVALYPRALTAGEVKAHYDARTVPFLPGSYPARVIQDGASNYWRLGETSGTTAVDVIGGVNGTISGGVTLGQPAKLTGDTAMAFNGTTSQILTTTAIDNPATMTVEAWIKTATAPQHPFFSTRNAPSANSTVYAGVASGLPFFFIDPVGGGAITGNTRVDDNKWHHLVYVISNVSVWLYVDGVLDRSYTLASRTLPATGAPAIGYDDDAGTRWTGLIDEVAFYPRALTAGDVTAHYTAGNPGSGTAGVPGWFLGIGGDDLMATRYNTWRAIVPSDTVNFPTMTDAILVGVAGDVAAVMENNQVVVLTLPAGAWVPIAARRVNATGTTATGLVALNDT